MVKDLNSLSVNAPALPGISSPHGRGRNNLQLTLPSPPSGDRGRGTGVRGIASVVHNLGDRPSCRGLWGEILHPDCQSPTRGARIRSFVPIHVPPRYTLSMREQDFCIDFISQSWLQRDEPMEAQKLRFAVWLIRLRH